MNVERIMGYILGSITSIFLLLPALAQISYAYVDIPRLALDNTDPGHDLGSLLTLVCLGFNWVGLFLAILTAILLLKKSRVFGVIFISLGLLNIYGYLLNMIYVMDIFSAPDLSASTLLFPVILLMSLPFMTILVGVGLIVSYIGLFRRLASARAGALVSAKSRESAARVHRSLFL